MKSTVTRIALSILIATANAHVAAEPTWAIAPAWTHSHDSDGLSISKWFAGALPAYASGSQWQGVELQHQKYVKGDETLTGQGVNYTRQNTDALTGLGYAYKLGMNQGPHQSIVTSDASWNTALSHQAQWGVFASRDWVESMEALQKNVHYDLVGANLDYQIHPRMTLIGSLAETHFSDGNHRQQQRARIVWDAWPEEGVTLQWAQKHQLGEKSAAPRLYFNPERLDESLGVIGWRRKFEGWQWYARVGRGHQNVSDVGSTPARQTEIQLSSPVHSHSFFKLRAGETETVGISGPGYIYRYIDLQWIFRI